MNLKKFYATKSSVLFYYRDKYFETLSPVTIHKPDPKSNIPEYSVSDLAFSIKRSLEESYGRIRVRGELSRVKVHTSGHMYSTLKDDKANLDVVCWRGSLSKLSVKPEEGLEVICTGRISSYPARSNYQLIIESMELAGEGALLKLLEERKKKLAAEGLFDPARKKELPFLPEVIGVVTSPTGAVIRDIMHRIDDRFPRPVYLWPVLVQGDGAAEDIVKAIEGFNSLSRESAVPRPDILIVGRGGGSLEDLMPFNEENVVRAVVGSEIPIISAVGHETDTTLCDFAADKRAPTPTGAAEIAVPKRMDLLAGLAETSHRLNGAISRRLQQAAEKTENLGARIGDPQRYLETKLQQFDFITDKLDRVFERFIDLKSNLLVKTSSRLVHPQSRIDDAKRRVQDQSERLKSAADRLLPPKRDKLAALDRMLESLSYHRVLDRGYVVVRDEKGRPVTDAAKIKDNQRAELSFKGDKKVPAILKPSGTPGSGKKTSAKNTGKAKTKASSQPKDQQSLF